ncbi:hypothetical protein SAMN05421788_106401 [Filimonas lacunae]|uniref:Uncharacterized protein n=1 Tax=Filimonas lacunae TaxID=477680 RepID=A0A173MFS9_9BACT|nr:hypothetical protein [Filimonas lacunae]BAV06339.1 hypothetical protein FLA_2355 [Filimonas lacunae]SIT25873.1 hypothetical protein SAMN05421788_106401 [Filimonas lacunae]
MELDDLKYRLKEKLEQPATADVSAQDIAGLMKRQTKSVLDKLTRSLWIEIICSLLCLIAFSIVALTSKQFVLRVYFGSVIAFAAALCMVQYYLVAKIKRYGNTPLPVKNNLNVIYTIVKNYETRCYWISMALLPLCLFFSLCLHYIAYAQLHEGAAPPIYLTWRPWIKMLSSLIVLSIAAHYLTKWYFRKLYGNYLKELLTYIDELQSPEEKAALA